MEIIEDRVFDAKEGVTNVVSGSVQPPTTPVQYGSYSEALKGNPYGMIMKFLEDFYVKGTQANVQMGRPDLGGSRYQNGWRNSQGQNGRYTSGVTGSRDGGNIQDSGVKCFRCGKMGHTKSTYRWAMGTCFSCNQVRHLARDFQNSQGMQEM